MLVLTVFGLLLLLILLHHYWFLFVDVMVDDLEMVYS